MRVLWSNMRVFKNVRAFEKMSRISLLHWQLCPRRPPGTYGVVGTQKHGYGLPYVDRAQRPETGGRNADPGHYKTFSGPLKPKLWLRKDLPIGKAPSIFPQPDTPGLYPLEDSLGGFLGPGLVAQLLCD